MGLRDSGPFSYIEKHSQLSAMRREDLITFTSGQERHLRFIIELLVRPLTTYLEFSK